MKFALLLTILTVNKVHCRLFGGFVRINMSSDDPEVVEFKVQYERFKFNVSEGSSRDRLTVNNITAYTEVYHVSTLIANSHLQGQNGLVFNSDENQLVSTFDVKSFDEEYEKNNACIISSMSTLWYSEYHQCSTP